MSKLSDRIRPDCEAAPWVVKEVKKLEQELEKWKTLAHKFGELGREFYDYTVWKEGDVVGDYPSPWATELRKTFHKLEKELNETL